MNVRELPVVFQCNEQSLVGIVHIPEKPKKIAILSIVAGGPQYRAGFGRQLIKMARRFSKEGITVMRFDYRGLGDSSGADAGFEHVGDDIDSAITTLMELEPTITEVILWGGCNAASAALIHGYHNAAVSGLILANPWVRTEESFAKVIVRDHYAKRVFELSFWLKVARFEYNPIPAMKTIISGLGFSKNKTVVDDADASINALPFLERMLIGATEFKGNLLFMMSGMSLAANEFDNLLLHSDQWRKVLNRTNVDRVGIENADQAFSTHEAREAMFSAAEQWLDEWDAV